MTAGIEGNKEKFIKDIFVVADNQYHDLKYGIVYAALAAPRLVHDAGNNAQALFIGNFERNSAGRLLIEKLEKDGIAYRILHRIWHFLKDLLISKTAVEQSA